MITPETTTTDTITTDTITTDTITTDTISPLRGAVTLAGAEARLLVRNRVVATTALVMPLALGGLLALNADGLTRGGWAGAAALQIIAMLGLAVYAGATTSLTARRQALYLKRLRSGELPDAAILAGLLGPFLALGALQAILLLGILVALGAPPPTNVALLALAVLGGSVVCCVAAAVTSGLTRSAETAQLTTTPLFVAIIAGGIWVITTAPAEVTARMLATPGGALADLVRRGYSGDGPLLDQLSGALPAIGFLAAWVVIGVVAATRTFRWDPRR
ncbi:MAG: multidrug ABC transporter permease [Pseudonocardiaceae bacterium]|nr:multidrug ABC transporter permease [Pseudonocardiaceae bacterium]